MQVKNYLKFLARRVVRGRAGVLRDGAFTVPDWDVYRMDLRDPFARLESQSTEERVVSEALVALNATGILATSRYDHAGYCAMRDAVRDTFDIPWTAISPRVQRLIYAINAIHQPAVMVAAGVFCGNTFISNAGAAVGPGAVYSARALIGLEINPEEAARAQANVRRIDGTGVARIVAEDAVGFCAAFADPIHLLYLDADGDRARGKGIYLEIAEAAWDKMPPGSLLLAHNSVNSAIAMRDYFAFVRDHSNCRASLNVVLDEEGLEISIK